MTDDAKGPKSPFEEKQRQHCELANIQWNQQTVAHVRWR